MSEPSWTSIIPVYDNENEELADLMRFFAFSYKPSSEYSGTVMFTMTLPHEDGPQCITRTIRADPHRGVEVFHGLPPDKDVSCHVELPFSFFHDLFWGNIGAKDLVTSGKCRVHNWAYRELWNFSCSLDTSTENWTRYYQWVAEQAAEESTVTIDMDSSYDIEKWAENIILFEGEKHMKLTIPELIIPSWHDLGATYKDNLSLVCPNWRDFELKDSTEPLLLDDTPVPTLSKAEEEGGKVMENFDPLALSDAYHKDRMQWKLPNTSLSDSPHDRSNPGPIELFTNLLNRSYHAASNFYLEDEYMHAPASPRGRGLQFPGTSDHRTPHDRPWKGQLKEFQNKMEAIPFVNRMKTQALQMYKKVEELSLTNSPHGYGAMTSLLEGTI